MQFTVANIPESALVMKALHTDILNFVTPLVFVQASFRGGIRTTGSPVEKTFAGPQPAVVFPASTVWRAANFDTL